MERKIGEIFEINGEWYQCVEHKGCHSCAFALRRGFGFECVFKGTPCCTCRSDGKLVIFKKLEKVGEPYEHCGKLYQCYKLPMEIEIRLLPNNCNPIGKDNLVEIEIKQTKEDMEENKTTLPKEDNALTRMIYAYVNGKISDKELIRSIKEMSDEYPYNKNNLTPFSLEAAKAGKPVCTRDGRKARIICFDRDWDMHIVALVSDPFGESVHYYLSNGKVDFDKQNDEDLMMLPEKKEGWVNVYYDNDASSHRGCRFIYDTKEQAVKEAGSAYITTVKINWEE